MNNTDLFGQPLPPEPVRFGLRASGYARRPGTGPAGETCRTCRFAVKVGGGKSHFYKCEIIRHRWTHGPGTDIKLRSPACEMWQDGKHEKPAHTKRQ